MTLKANCPDLSLAPITTADPKGPDGSDVLPETFFDAVMEFCRLTEQDCTLETYIE